MDNQSQSSNIPSADQLRKQMDDMTDIALPSQDTHQAMLLAKILEIGREVMEMRRAADPEGDRGQALLQREGVLGGRIFGPLRNDQERSFFCLNENSWIWHESRFNRATRQTEKQAIHYEVQAQGITKLVQNGEAILLEGGEFKNFFDAVVVYLRIVERQIYHRK